MKTLRLIPLIIVLASCSTIQPGNDPVVVNAERATQLALETFNLIEKTEFEVYPALKLSNPTVAAQIRTFTNKVRADSPTWLASARSLTQAYKQNRTAENKANLETAVAVLVSATAEATRYIALMATTNAWLSYQLADHVNERK